MIIRLPITSLLILVLAVWRTTHLLWGEDGPGDIFARLRRIAGAGFFGRLMDCFYCLSFWVAVPAACAAGDTWTERGLLCLSLSGGAILIERVTARTPKAPPAVWHEKPAFDEHPTEKHTSKENPHNVLLR